MLPEVAVLCLYYAHYVMDLTFDPWAKPGVAAACSCNASVLHVSYAQNYAGIIHQGLMQWLTEK